MPNALRDAGITTIDVQDALKSRQTTLVRPAEIARPGSNEFRCEEDVWSIAYAGAGARLTALKGFHDIARLLAQPNEPLHCLELSGSAIVNEATDEVLDQEARREYRRRIEELQSMRSKEAGKPSRELVSDAQSRSRRRTPAPPVGQAAQPVDSVALARQRCPGERL